MVRVLAVLATPPGPSYTRQLFDAAVQTVRDQGAQVQVLDLYDHAQRIPFFMPKPETSLKGEQLAFYLETKASIMAADRLLIVYPVYWYSLPGILKCWLDLITNYAWRYKGINCADGLHHIGKAFVINRADMPWWYRLLFTRNSPSEQLKETFKFMGIPNYSFCEVNGRLDDTQKERQLARVKRKLSSFV